MPSKKKLSDKKRGRPEKLFLLHPLSAEEALKRLLEVKPEKKESKPSK